MINLKLFGILFLLIIFFVQKYESANEGTNSYVDKLKTNPNNPTRQHGGRKPITLNHYLVHQLGNKKKEDLKEKTEEAKYVPPYRRKDKGIWIEKPTSTSNASNEEGSNEEIKDNEQLKIVEEYKLNGLPIQQLYSNNYLDLSLTMPKINGQIKEKENNKHTSTGQKSKKQHNSTNINKTIQSTYMSNSALDPSLSTIYNPSYFNYFHPYVQQQPYYYHDPISGQVFYLK
ncbi:hypothetical protein Mgra_00008772 [Meloidogyne graminicola]|uniref:Uncharacterized protein n=1 Tax=Meloidogyne graminicola TaxID=189291 RepID=A0A8S9ZEZ2_9BILA|nr:hypothetical protein Mgra_00008772 [Meloidogyne graminicola]